MIWAKTEAGRAEIQARALVMERARRNLLLVIDGRKTDEMLLAHLAGVSAPDFLMLESLGLIAPAQSAAGAAPLTSTLLPVGSAPAAPPSQSPAASPSAPLAKAPATPATPGDGSALPASASAPAATVAVTTTAPLDYAQFTAALTQIISRELGLRGFMLTLAVERASTPEELRAVAERTLAQVLERRGEASAAAASRALFGA